MKFASEEIQFSIFRTPEGVPSRRRTKIITEFSMFDCRLRAGWSVKTQDLQMYGKEPQTLNEMEQTIIKQVIQRAEVLDQKEQERVG